MYFNLLQWQSNIIEMHILWSVWLSQLPSNKCCLAFLSALQQARARWIVVLWSRGCAPVISLVCEISAVTRLPGKIRVFPSQECSTHTHWLCCFLVSVSVYVTFPNHSTATLWTWKEGNLVRVRFFWSCRLSKVNVKDKTFEKDFWLM